MFKITREQAREIVKRCNDCAPHLPVPHLGVNPRGLIPNEIWQMDVTHFTPFKKMKYLHVTIETFSSCIFASLLTGEASKDVITHTLHCFTVLGKPKIIKTNNGPGYTGAKFQRFCFDFQIKHITGIPYNPQGQGIVERAHQTLKNTLSCLKNNPLVYTTISPHNQLSHALFVINFLTLDSHGRSAADWLWHPKTNELQVLVKWKDPLTFTWKGPERGAEGPSAFMTSKTPSFDGSLRD